MSELEDKILADFNAIELDLKKWGKFVDESLSNIVLKNLVDNYKVKIKPSFRLKEEKSYISKALWRERDKPYTNPLNEIEDKIGTRVVFLFSIDVKKASEFVLESSLWVAKITKKYDEISEKDPEKFGYQSIHVVVHPKEQNGYVHDVKDLTCEIQLRTLLQHAYSEISHDSTYKGPFKKDKEIARKLSKSMALMEATDDYFCSIFEMIADETRKVHNFSVELISIYKTIDPNFISENLDRELTEIFFNFLDDFDISIDGIKEMYQKNKVSIDYAIKNPINYLPTQPVFILVAYLFFNHRHTFEEKWPLMSQQLEELYLTFGVSRN